MRKKKLIVANWKMNPPSVAEARVLFGKTKLAGGKLEKVETVICPPFPYLGLFANAGTSRVSLGAQDVFWTNSGRATGEVSPEMLKDLGVSYVIVGHSERRALGETNELVSKKLKAVLTEGLTPIVCIGEKERDPEGGYFGVLKAQIVATFSGLTRPQFRDLCIAYEPIFAIGKSAKDALEPRGIREMAIFIQKVVADMYGEETAQLPRILYGGSVEESNTASILTEGGVSGLLVGHASLDTERFTKMLKSANSI
ncbi:MAG: triose-phosphate isomerase [bacterium]|nr:triose-phosphate isomerase [bacterium]